MAKIKMTRKYIVENYPNIIYIPYAEAQMLLSCVNPTAYTSGTYGWNFDMFYEHGVTICTGYRNMPGVKAVQIKEYEAKARTVIREAKVETWQEMREKIAALFAEFCEINKKALQEVER